MIYGYINRHLPNTTMAKFTDITNHWAQAVIEQLADQKILTGYLNGQFKPDAPVNRAEFAAMLSRAFPHHRPIQKAIAFRDVPPSYWAYGVIQSAYTSGFMGGYPQQRFQPTDPITRLQALIALANGLNYKPQQPVELTLNETFNDADTIPEYARSPIAAAAERGLVVNYPHVKQLRPGAIATRAEIAAILAQARSQPNFPSAVPHQYIAQVTLKPPVALTGELRGLWLTELSHLSAETIKTFASLHLNTFYPSIWHQGQTPYPSPVLQRFTNNNPSEDFLAELIPAATRNRISIIPWFQDGWQIPAHSPIIAQRPHWITTRQDGSSIFEANGQSQMWLNPFHPQVQQFILDLIVEVVSRYDIAGIQLDQSFILPVEWGYDRFTTQLYQRDHQGQSPSKNPQDEEWVQWRSHRLTSFLQRLALVVKDYKPYCILSFVSHFPTQKTLQNWSLWQREKLIEEMIVFPGDLDHPQIQLAHYEMPVGLRIGITPETSFDQIRAEVVRGRDRALAGIAFYNDHSLLAAIAQTDTQPALQSLFPEMVERPQKL